MPDQSAAITHGGDTLRQVRVAGFTVAEALYEPHLRVPVSVMKGTA